MEVFALLFALAVHLVWLAALKVDLALVPVLPGSCLHENRWSLFVLFFLGVPIVGYPYECYVTLGFPGKKTLCPTSVNNSQRVPITPP